MILWKPKIKYEIAHDNLNDIWLLVDIMSNKKYKFYSVLRDDKFKTKLSAKLK